MSKLKKELIRFIIAGVCAVATDLIVYYILLTFLTHNISKGISFIAGTIVAYIINKFWTFEKKEKSYSEMMRFALLYGFSLSINILTNKLVLDFTSIVLIAFLIATGASTIVNFFGQKLWVFK
ncbi:GtrA family protein [Corallibacter sp.]|uniref:GtrA family protein n=1 Tax=Corallibacter sp. TaxID=2038084 RepID=UPI003AB4B6F0